MRKVPLSAPPLLSWQRIEIGPAVNVVVMLTSSTPQLADVPLLKSPTEAPTQIWKGDRRSLQQSCLL